jgi:hypothetical protein
MYWKGDEMKEVKIVGIQKESEEQQKLFTWEGKDGE